MRHGLQTLVHDDGFRGKILHGVWFANFIFCIDNIHSNKNLRSDQKFLQPQLYCAKLGGLSLKYISLMPKHCFLCKQHMGSNLGTNRAITFITYNARLKLALCSFAKSCCQHYYFLNNLSIIFVKDYLHTYNIHFPYKCQISS